MQTINYSKRSPLLITKLIWFSIAFLFVNYIAMDLIRKLISAPFYIYLFQDLILLVVYFFIFLYILLVIIKYKKYTFSSPLKGKGSFLLTMFIISLFASVIFSSIMSYSNLPLLINIAGIRTYLLALPMLFVGYILAYSIKDRAFLQRANTLLTAIFLFLVLLIFIQYIAFIFGISILPAMEHEYRSFGKDYINLFSGPFASSKKYARFTVICFVLLWAVRQELNIRTKHMSLLLFLAVIIAGSRESSIMAIVFLLFILFKEIKERNKIHSRNQTRISNGLSFFLISSLITVITIILSISTQTFSFLFAGGDAFEFLRRAIQFFPFFYTDWSDSQILIGNGPGYVGQETKFIPGFRDELDRQSVLLNENILFGSSYITFVDAGFTKIMQEIGLIGLLSYGILTCIILNFVRIFIIRHHSNIAFALSFTVFFWLMLFLKGHQIFSDMFMSVILYLSLGALFKFLRERDHSNEPQRK